jgi:hypothetical protein
LFRAIPFNIHTPSPLWIRVGRFIDKTEKTIFKKNPDSIDFSFDKKTKKPGEKSGKYLKLQCRNSGGLETIRIHILYPGLFQMCVKAKIRPKYS